MKSRPDGFTLIELMIVAAIILVLSALAVPHLMRSKVQANETSALGVLNTLNNALFDYWTNYDAYPESLSSLEAAEASLASGTHSGYTFTYTYGGGTVVNHEVNPQSYSITAVPIAPGVTGMRYFSTDQSGLIRAERNGLPTALSPAVN